MSRVCAFVYSFNRQTSRGWIRSGIGLSHAAGMNASSECQAIDTARSPHAQELQS